MGTAVLIAPLMAAVLIAPAWLPALVLVRRAGAPASLTAPFAFSLTLALLGATTLVAHYAHLALWVAAVAALLLALTISVCAWPRRVAPAGRVSPLAWTVGVGAALLSLFEGVWFSHTADTFYHLAAARSLLATGRPLPTDPFYGTSPSTLDATSGVWHAMLAALAGASHLDVALLWAPLAALCSTLLALASFALAEHISGSPRIAAVVTALLLLTRMNLDVRAMSYPNQGSLVCLLVTTWALIALAEKPLRAAAAIALVAGFAGAMVHLATAEFAFVILLAVAVGSVFATLGKRRLGEEATWRPLKWLVTVGLLLAVAVSPALLSRWASVSGAQIEPANFRFAKTFIDAPLGVLVPRVGWMVGRPGLTTAASVSSLAWLLAVIGLAAAVLVLAWRRGDSRGLSAAALAAIGPALCLPPLSIALSAAWAYMLARLLGLAAYFVLLVVAWLLAQRGPSGRLARGLGIGFAAVALLMSLPTVLGRFVPAVAAPEAVSASIPANWRADIRRAWRDELPAMRDWAGVRYPVVATDPTTGYQLAGLVPVGVIAVGETHSPFAIEKRDGERRRRDSNAVVAVTTSVTGRHLVLERYGASAVVVSAKTPDAPYVAEALDSDALLTSVVRSPSLSLWRLR